MRKIMLCLVALFALGMSACEKENRVTRGTENFKKVHIQLNANSPIVHDEVVSYAHSGGPYIKIETKKSGWIAVSNGYMLYNSEKCPICGM